MILFLFLLLLLFIIIIIIIIIISGWAGGSVSSSSQSSPQVIGGIHPPITILLQSGLVVSLDLFIFVEVTLANYTSFTVSDRTTFSLL